MRSSTAMLFRRNKPKERVQVLTQDQVSIRREVKYIIGLAQAREGRIVTIGNLVLFSTESGDAWMLDPAEAAALSLACDGEKQRFVIEETKDRFAIGWTHTFSLERDSMLVMDRSGKGRLIYGYPVHEIKRAVRNSQR
jgi:hypothetical protein